MRCALNTDCLSLVYKEECAYTYTLYYSPLIINVLLSPWEVFIVTHNMIVTKYDCHDNIPHHSLYMCNKVYKMYNARH